jgi:hypothetical protein
MDDGNDIDIKSWMLRIEKRLGKLEGEMNVVLLILSAMMGILITLFTKI